MYSFESVCLNFPFHGFRRFLFNVNARPKSYENVCLHLASRTKFFTKEEGLTPTGLVWNTNVAAFLFFWDTNVAAVTSCENALL